LDGDNFFLENSRPPVGTNSVFKDDILLFGGSKVGGDCPQLENEESKQIEDCRAPQVESPLLLTEDGFVFEMGGPLLGTLLNE
jgi:hypothetical protein